MKLGVAVVVLFVSFDGDTVGRDMIIDGIGILDKIGAGRTCLGATGCEASVQNQHDWRISMTNLINRKNKFLSSIQSYTKVSVPLRGFTAN